MVYTNFTRIAAFVLFCALLAPAAHAAGGESAKIFLWLAVILAAARVAGPLIQHLGMPAVLGELLAGIVLGNLSLAGVGAFEPMESDPIVAFIAELGVVILLFQVGLETDLRAMARVGARAMAVAVIGVAVPFGIGYYAGPLLLPGATSHAYLFLGATLAATSVGITGRVFRDLDRLDTREARIVLGAAVIDDVLGLIILAVVSSLVRTGSVGAASVAYIVLEAVAFLVGSVALGRILAPRLAAALARLDPGEGMLLTLVVGIALFLAWLAGYIGLAPIVGAFAAGLLLEPVFLGDFEKPKIAQDVEPALNRTPGGVPKQVREILDRHTEHQYRELVEPIGHIFVPVFFVFTGMQVKLETLAEPALLGLALAITLMAIAGKLAAGLAAGHARWIVGWGMVPRGEVGLIFAMVGKELGVVNEAMFSAVVVMVVLTTLVTPPVLARLLRA